MILKIIRNTTLMILVLIILLNIVFLNTKVSNNYPNTIIDTNQITEVRERIPLAQDEWHTLFLGMYRVYNKDFNEIRVGSTTRNLIILLSPLSVVYMNSHLGGEHTIVGNLTHKYSGYWYIERAVEDFPGNTFLSYVYDPNLQNFRFFTIFLRNTLFLISVLLIVHYFYKNSHKVTSLIFLTLSIFNPFIVNASVNLYTDLTNYLLLNLLIINLLYFNKEKLLSYLSVGIILSLLIGNTIGNVLLIPIIFLYIFIKYWDKKTNLIFSIVTFFSSYLLFNIYELTRSTGRPRGVDYIDQQLWNLWHYQTGHYYIEPSGLNMIRNIISDHLPYSIFFILIFFYKSFENKNIQGIFIVFSLLQFLIILGSFSNAKYAGDLAYRNLATVFTLGIFCFCLLLTKIEIQYINKKNALIVSLLILIINAGFTFQEIQNKNVDLNILSNKYNCEIVGGQDVDKKIKIDTEIGFEITERIEASELEKKYTNLISQKNIDCIFIKSSRSNKFLSNYLLLKEFELKYRHADYMFFVNKNILDEEFSLR